jgi:hypothetical protein
MSPVHLCAALSLFTVLFPLSARASYYSLVPGSQDSKECITYDARYPYRTKQIYIATYPHHSWSREGWTAEYYGGVVHDVDKDSASIFHSSWQMHGNGAPASGIDFVYAGPYAGWHRSTWEGSSGGIGGNWPADKFKPGQWYRFVHRVWRPTSHVSHLGYAGVWMKSIETGAWYHLATFKFPAELTGFNDMGGFMEYFGGQASEKVAAEFRNVYALCGGKWASRPDFTASSAADDGIRLVPGERSRSVTLETTRNPFDPNTRKRKKSPIAHEKFTLRQPDQPDFFDDPQIASASAEYMGNQLVVRWVVSPKASPQLGYAIKVYNGSSYAVATVAEYDPEARQCSITLRSKSKGKPLVSMFLRDIFGQDSAKLRFATTPSEPLAPRSKGRLAPGLAYRYYESEKPDTWSALPDFSKLAPQRNGTTGIPDLTPRLRRNGYAFQFDGFLRAAEDGLYTFNLIAASGARLTLGGTTVIEADGNRSIARYTGAIALKSGDHPIVISYYHGQGRQRQADDFLQMTWAGPGFDATPVPASAFTHAVLRREPILAVEARFTDGIRLELSSRLIGYKGKPARIQYYAVNDQFDYFSQQGASSADYFLADTSDLKETLPVPIWGGGNKIVRARAVLDEGRTVDSPALVVRAAAPPGTVDQNGMRVTALEHHLYPMNSRVAGGTVTVVGESMGLLTRPHKGDVTLIARLAGITPSQPLPDGTRLESVGDWYSGIILRENLDPRPGEPLGGAEIPFIALFGSADGATRHCDSSMINGAGNQPSGDVGHDSKWFKLTRKGAELAAYISKDGKEWKLVKTAAIPKMKEQIEVGFVHYAIPCPTPYIHWARFDNISISGGESQDSSRGGQDGSPAPKGKSRPSRKPPKTSSPQERIP